MKKAPHTAFRAPVPLPALPLLVFGLWLMSGCASFPGRDLPVYSYADLALAPADKLCLVTAATATLSDGDREIIDTTLAMLEKSGYFQRAPGQCAPNREEEQTSIQWDFRNDTRAGNRAVAFISGFISGFTFTIVPGFGRDEFQLTVRLRKNDQVVKEYVYREHIDTWTHFSLLLMMSDHKPRDAVREVYTRMIMNFLHDYSRDVQRASRIAAGQ